jgi:hypothetical protein
LSVGKNKESLIELFFQHLKQGCQIWWEILYKNIQLFVSHVKKCHKFCTNNREKVQIEECEELYSDHEEADTQLLLHVKQASRSWSYCHMQPWHWCIHLAIGHKLAIPTALYFDTRIGNQRRILDVGKVHLTLGSQLCDALIGFHAFTCIHSCDVLSQIY